MRDDKLYGWFAPSSVPSQRWGVGHTRAMNLSMIGSNISPQLPSWCWTWLATVYAIEARNAFAPIEERVERRRNMATPSDNFFAWTRATLAKLSAKSNLADAWRHALNRQEALSRFVTDGWLEIDNNTAEKNAMSCIAVGRKNYLPAGSGSGGDRAAAIYIITRTAKLNGVVPKTYLRDALAKIAEDS